METEIKEMETEIKFPMTQYGPEVVGTGFGILI